MKLLILDLDETLIHATENSLTYEADLETELYHIYKRPYLDHFLAFCRENFEVGIWTTAGREFANIVIENVFPKNYPLKFLWSFKHCTRMYDPELMESYYIKNLAKLKRMGYRLEHMIMVDDTPKKLERNYGNLVRIKAWLGNPKDRELLRPINYLSDLKKVENVRAIDKRLWENEYEL